NPGASMTHSSRFPSARTTAMSLAVTVAACLSAGLAAAETKTLYIGMNGGTMEKTYTEHVFGPFAQANKDKPQMHVMFLDDGIMYRAIGMGLCEKMQPSPALNDLFPIARFKGD